MKLSRHWTVLLFVCGLTAASTHIAASPTPHLTAQAGINVSTIGETQQVALFNTLSNTYEPDRVQDSSAVALLGAGLTFFQNAPIAISSNITYVLLSRQTLNGEIWRLQNPNFNNLNYKFNLQSHVWLFDNYFRLTKYKLQPNFIAGVGFAENKSSHYVATSKTQTSQPMLQPFADSTRTPFAYELGFGVSRALKRVNVIIAYRYISAGKGQLGLTPVQNTTDHLSTGHINDNILTLGLEFHDLLPDN